MNYVLSGKPSFTPGLRFRLYSILKRILDFFFAIFISIFAAIPCLTIALLVKCTSKGPAIFRQERVGLHGRPFTCYKFRTMKITAPKSEATCLLKNADEHITGLGRILRKTSLDELPQLVNILKGDMSFVGPRPLIPQEKSIHKERYKRGVYYLRPGISGLAQINGRDTLGAEKKVAYDEEYLHSFSLKTDIGIVIGTVLAVLGAKDIVEGENNDLK